MLRKQKLFTLVVVAMLCAPAACRQQGPMEKAGEAIDDTLERHDGK